MKVIKLNEDKLRKLIRENIKKYILESEDAFDIYDDEYNDMQLYNSKLVDIINMLNEFVEEYGYDESGHIQNAINELKECQNESMVEFME